MPKLADSQAAFARALAEPSDPAPFDVRRPGGITANVAQTKRFDVYRNNVTVTAIDALGDTFPAVRALVGDDFFRATARAYLDQSPPRSPLLFRYGATFGDFLEAFPPAARVPYLGDVARLEFARLQAYHAADVLPIAISTLGEMPPDQVANAVLETHPSVSLIRSAFPVVSLWGASSGLTSSDQVDIGRAEDALTVRPGLNVESRILPAGGGPFLAALLDGKTLGEAAATAAAAVPDFDLSAHLTGLFEAGTFVRAILPTCRPHRPAPPATPASA
ncbi:MAG: DNA-binding domain-containing protein [Pseudomonadota bacterium]